MIIAFLLALSREFLVFFLVFQCLVIEYFFVFELRPYEMRFFLVFCHLKPKPSLDYCLNQIAVISKANINFEGFLVFFYIELAIDVVSVVDDEQKLFVFIDFDADAVFSGLVGLERGDVLISEYLLFIGFEDRMVGFS